MNRQSAAAVIDAARFNRTHWLILGWGCFIMLFDGYDMVIYMVGLPAIRFAGEGDEGSLFRELQVDGLGATWAVPGLEALMEEPALKGELWRAMRRVRQRWSSEIQ